MRLSSTSSLQTFEQSLPGYPLSVREMTKLVWLRGKVEAEMLMACRTDLHEPWLCDPKTAARLSFARWLVQSGQLTEFAGALTSSRALRSEDWSPS